MGALVGGGFGSARGAIRLLLDHRDNSFRAAGNSRGAGTQRCGCGRRALMALTPTGAPTRRSPSGTFNFASHGRGMRWSARGRSYRSLCRGGRRAGLNLNSGGGGAVRLWVRPLWSSASCVEGGTGPGAYGSVAEVGVTGVTPSVWSLRVVPDGSALSLVGESDGGRVELLNAPIAWRAGVWHLVALNFGPEGTALFIDGRLAVEGAGTAPVPPGLACLVLGSSQIGGWGNGRRHRGGFFFRPPAH